LAVWIALWATAVIAAFAYGYVHGLAADPGPFAVVVPLAFLAAYGSWRLSRYYFRQRDAAKD
jgi:hypothetical protein